MRTFSPWITSYIPSSLDSSFNTCREVTEGQILQIIISPWGWQICFCHFSQRREFHDEDAVYSLFSLKSRDAFISIHILLLGDGVHSGKIEIEILILLLTVCKESIEIEKEKKTYDLQRKSYLQIYKESLICIVLTNQTQRYEEQQRIIIIIPSLNFEWNDCYQNDFFFQNSYPFLFILLFCIVHDRVCAHVGKGWF